MIIVRIKKYSKIKSGKMLKRLFKIFFLFFYFIIFTPDFIKAQTFLTPSDIGGLKLWLTADQVHHGAGVDTCYDLSLSGNNAVQNLSAEQPVIGANTLNTHKVMHFDGVNDFLQFSEISDIQTVFWVIREDSLAASSFRSLLGSLTAYDFLRGSNKEIWSSVYANNFITTGLTRLDTTVIDGTTTLLPPKFSIISLVTTGNVKADNFSNERGNSGRYWDGDLAELIIYNQALSIPEVRQIEEYLHNKYAPPIRLGNDTTVCSFPIVLKAKRDYLTTYQWRDNTTLDSLVVNSPGTYYVTVQDVFGFTSSDSITISFLGVPDPYQLPDTLTCGNPVIWNSGLTKNQCTFEWQDFSTDSLITITQSGQYFLTVKNAIGCTKSTAIANVIIDNFSSLASLGSNVNLCSGNSIYLTSGAIQAINYTWSDSSHNDSLQVIKPIGAYTYWVTVSDSNNCSKTDSIDVTIVGVAPISDFSFNETCLGNATQFTDLSTPTDTSTITNWQWDFGDPSSNVSDTSTIQNPQHYYATAGTYTVRLIAKTNAGCESAINKLITIHPKPIVNFTEANLCSNCNVQFTATVTIFGDPITNWNWNFGDASSGSNNTSSLQNPSHIYADSGTYSATVIVQNTSGCRDTSNHSLSIIPSFLLPSDIGGLKLWIVGDSVHHSNFPQVDTCYDLSLNNNSAAQNTSALQGISVNSNLNSHEILRFDGIDDRFNYSPITDIRTVFWVIREDSSASSDLRPLLGSSSLYDFHRGNNKEIWSSGNANIFVRQGITKLNSTVIDGTTTILPPQWSLVSLVTTDTVTADNFSSDRNATNRVWSGDLAELIIYNQPLDTFQVGQIEQYLSNKYMPAFSLGHDTTLCALPITLKAKKNYFTNYLWSDNSTADSLIVNSSGTYSVTVTNIFGKTSSSTITITQDTSTYIVNLGQDTTICNGQQLILNAGPSLYNYSWFNSSTSNSYTASSSDTYFVSVTDCKSHVSTDTLNLIVNPIPVFSLGSDTTTCFNTTYVLKPNLVNLSAYTFIWSDLSTDSTLLTNHTGQYYLNVRDAIGCSFNDSIQISIDSSLINVSLGPDTSFCSGNSIYLTSGAAPGLTYTWSDGTHNDSLQVVNPGGSYTYSLIVTNANSCSKTDTINVSVSGIAPTPNFSFTSTCLGNVTQFTDLSTSTNTISSRLWNFGDPSSGVSDTSTIQNPQHYYDSAGTYTVRLIVRTSTGCESATNKIIIVHPKPIANFAVTNLCSNSYVHFIPSVTTFGDSITNWNWNFGDASSGNNDTSSLQSPSHIFATGGTLYNVDLIVQNASGCADTSANTITIKTSPIADFNYSLACKDQVIHFTDNTTYQGSILASTIWNFGDGVTITSSLNPNHSYPSNVGYQVIHVITDNYNCKDSVIKTVQVYPTPDAYFSIGNSCVNAPTDFTDLSVISGGAITNWQWDFNTSASSNLQNPQYTFNTAGNVNVELLVTSDQGCKDSLTQTFAVHPLPVANFIFTPQYGNPPLAVSFTNTSSGASSYLWDFGDGSTFTTIVNPLHTYIDTGSFAISLTAMNNFGCEQTKIKIIPILRRLIDVAVMAIYDTLQNNFLTTSAQIVNLGTTDITSMDIYISVNNGPAIKENKTVSIPSSGIYLYKSNSSIYLEDAIHFVCLTIENPNHLPDENPANNQLCEALDLSAFQILDIYPNPSNDLITLPLIIPEQRNLNITIYDANGKVVRSVYSGNIDKGLQLITINVSELNSGFYGCKIEYGNQTFVKKFIKR